MMALVATLVVLFVVYQSIYATTGHSEHILTVDKGETYHSLLSKKPWSDAFLSSAFVTKAYVDLPQISHKLETIKCQQVLALTQMIRILNKGGMATEFSLRIIEVKTVKSCIIRLRRPMVWF